MSLVPGFVTAAHFFGKFHFFLFKLLLKKSSTSPMT